MNRKRNVSFIKPEDPAFLKAIKRQAGYDDRNHKFDELENDEEDFVDDTESEKPQVVVLGDGDLTAEEAEAEQKQIEIAEAEIKADLSQRIIFKSKQKTSSVKPKKENLKTNKTKTTQLLSFGDDEEEEEE